VVLARTIEVDAGRVLDPRLLVHRLRAVDPDAYAFAVPTDAGVLVGASPELLVLKRGTEIRSNPLAGSAPRSGDAEEDRELARGLDASAKDREEHAIVVDAVAEALRPFCDELRWDPEPVLLQTANVWHLSTRFRGALRDPAISVLELVAALHPTPAVGGTPRTEALAAIAELEPFERGRYAGSVGWVDANGDGAWALALRCAELRGETAILYAGAGIVADSDPASELDETDRKFRSFLDALRWG
jgi:isochorismate synthase